MQAEKRSEDPNLSYEGRVQQIAEQYRRRGYDVIIAPSGHRLPDFLQSFQPDIIADGEDASIVVELKTPSKVRREGYWADLSKTIQQHPGWHFELVYNAGLDQEIPTSIDIETVRSRLEEGTQLAQSKMEEAALLITWSAAEASMRLVADKHRLKMPSLRPAVLITVLYTEGYMDREDYDLLMHCMDIRNRVAHGYSEGSMGFSCIQELRLVTMRLLKEIRPAKTVV